MKSKAKRLLKRFIINRIVLLSSLATGNVVIPGGNLIWMLSYALYGLPLWIAFTVYVHLRKKVAEEDQNLWYKISPHFPTVFTGFAGGAALERKDAIVFAKDMLPPTINDLIMLPYI